MNTKEYIVILKKDVDYDTFWAEMEDPTSGLPHIPDRAVSILNNFDVFDRMCGYALTDTEADRVRNDPRVAGVEIPLEQMPGVVIKRAAVEDPSLLTPPGNFTKPTTNTSTGASINWGLIRNSNRTNVYGNSATTSLNYIYTFDGTGVDVVISDSGIQADHPEFQYVGNTTSRVQPINWSTYVPALSSMGNCYQDNDGHGTHVAGIATGKTYGWAKGSYIYPIIATGPTQPTPANQFAAIKLWHQSKGANGRPTVVNMSWGSFYSWKELGGLPDNTPATVENVKLAMNNFIATITSVTYQGTTYSGNANLTNYGLLLDPNDDNCVNSFYNGMPLWALQTLDQLQTLIDAGIIVVAAAGNNSYKIDIPVGGTGDYDNYVTTASFGSFYYQRGSTPHVANSINVGNQDSVVYSSTLDQKSTFSATGPGVDVYAAGNAIMSSTTSNLVAQPTSAPYFLNNSFRQLIDAGTSMSSPQIAGMAALYLQANPPANNLNSNNCSQVKSWITSVATNTMYSPGNATTYTNFRSTQGGNARIAYQSITRGNLILTPSTLPNSNVTVGSSYSTTLSATGGIPPYNYAVINNTALPASLTLNSNGTLSGNVTANGNYTFDVAAFDSTFSVIGNVVYGNLGASAYSMSSINLSATPTTLPTAYTGIAYSRQLTAVGGTSPYTYALASGTLPTGITLSSSGLVSGTCNTPGTYSAFTIRITDVNGYVATQQYPGLVVATDTVTISPTTLPNWTVRVPYSQTITATGIAPITYSVVSGTLPQGLTLNSNTGVIAGTPTALGNRAFTIRATDSLSVTGQQAYTISITGSITNNAIEVYVAGARVTSGYNIINQNPVEIVFDTPPQSGVDVTILVNRGVTWYAPGVGTPSDGQPLQQTNTQPARFLRGL